jgi:hypothetical protein
MVCETSLEGEAPAEKLVVSFERQSVFERPVVFQPRRIQTWEFRW